VAAAGAISLNLTGSPDDRRCSEAPPGRPPSCSGRCSTRRAECWSRCIYSPDVRISSASPLFRLTGEIAASGIPVPTSVASGFGSVGIHLPFSTIRCLRRTGQPLVTQQTWRTAARSRSLAFRSRVC